jgi:hypothetical protein
MVKITVLYPNMDMCDFGWLKIVESTVGKLDNFFHIGVGFKSISRVDLTT